MILCVAATKTSSQLATLNMNFKVKILLAYNMLH